MKEAVLFLLLISLCGVGWCQFQEVPASDAAAVARSCGGPLVGEGWQMNTVRNIIQRFAPNPLFTLSPAWITVINKNDVNAVTLAPVGKRFSVVCVYSGLMAVMQDSEAELAAVIAHELGHAFDLKCRQYVGVGAPRPSLEVQRTCETRADEMGFRLLVNARYNPYAMGGMFGRLEAFSGDTSTNFLARLNNTVALNHPMTPDRMSDVHRMIAQYVCKQNPGTCQK